MTTVTSLAPPAGGAEEPAAGLTRRERLAGLAQRHGALAVLVLVLASASVASSNFATTGNLGAILVGSSYTSLLALGMTFVIISGGIDLSVGSVFALGGVLAAYGAGHGGLVAALGLPLAVTGLLGLVQGLLVARAGLPAFIVTLAGMLGARGLLLALTHEGQRTYLVPSGSVFGHLGSGTWPPVLTALVLFLAGGVVLQRTGFGQALFAIGGNEQAASLMGLAVARTKVVVYVQSALLAGLAGALSAARLQSGVTNTGVGYELVAIAAVVIGGTLLTGGFGSVSGTLVGVLLLAVIQNLIGHYVSQYGSAASDTVNGGFLAVVVLLQTYLARAQRVA